MVGHSDKTLVNDILQNQYRRCFGTVGHSDKTLVIDNNNNK